MVLPSKNQPANRITSCETVSQNHWGGGKKDLFIILDHHWKQCYGEQEFVEKMKIFQLDKRNKKEKETSVKGRIPLLQGPVDSIKVSLIPDSEKKLEKQVKTVVKV